MPKLLATYCRNFQNVFQALVMYVRVQTHESRVGAICKNVRAIIKFCIAQHNSILINDTKYNKCLLPAKGEVVLHLTSLPLGVAKDVLRTNTLFTPASYGDRSSSSSFDTKYHTRCRR